jgi:hypothetical protein
MIKSSKWSNFINAILYLYIIMDLLTPPHYCLGYGVNRVPLILIEIKHSSIEREQFPPSPLNYLRYSYSRFGSF